MTTASNIPALASTAERVRSFALWSQAYDQLPNPMLSLEEGFVAPLLPSLEGKDVVDLGCGTGRWLQRLATAGVGSLIGIDSSPEMLALARQKLGEKAQLELGTVTALPLPNASADVILSSFVAGYVPDIGGFARELRRAARSDAHVFVSDVHPETAAACHWTRSFRAKHGNEVQMANHAHSLGDLLGQFRSAGFEIVCMLEPSFGAVEYETLRRAGKLDTFYAADGLPAIYVMQLVPRPRTSVAAGPRLEVAELSLQSATVALDADAATRCTVEIRNGRIASLSSRAFDASRPGTSRPNISLHGYVILPGLINAHDHLEFGLYPNLGVGPYANSADWARDIHRTHGATIAAHQSVPRETRVWWSAIRNLLCGVTTICHHNPLHPELLAEDFPVRVVTNFGWAHSLAMDPEPEEKLRNTPPDWPFVLHACEGVDQTCAGEIFELDRRGVLDARTVIVHGLLLNAEGIELLNRRDAAVVWCPSSNRFLFGRTLSHAATQSIRQLLLGSDSPLTAVGDLLDEVRLAHGAGLSATAIYRMLLRKAASVLRLRNGEGSVLPGAVADVLAVRNKGMNPAETMVGLSWRDVELVIVGGRVQLASKEIFGRLPPLVSEGLEPMEVEGTLRWIRAPLGHLFREAQQALGDEITVGGKRVRHVGTA